MKFFQNSVLHKYQKAQDQESIGQPGRSLPHIFTIRKFSKTSAKPKKNNFRKAFCANCLLVCWAMCSILRPTINLTTELKNEKGAKKADGAILSMGYAPLSTRELAPLNAPSHKVIAVIELKGTDTKDLDKINVQAFNYKNNHPGCIYVDYFKL